MARSKIARRLRDRIVIEANSPTTNKGVTVDDWNTIANGGDVPADVRYETAGERMRAGRAEARQSIRVLIRNEWTITAKNRITWNGATWQVHGPPEFPDDRHRFMRFVAVRTDADQE